MAERHGGMRQGSDQIIAKFHEADAMLATVGSIGQVCQRLAVSEQTYQRWTDQ